MILTEKSANNSSYTATPNCLLFKFLRIASEQRSSENLSKFEIPDLAAKLDQFYLLLLLIHLDR